MPRSIDVSNSDDVIDSRDVIARIEELRKNREDYNEGDDEPDWDEDFPDESVELEALEAFNAEGESNITDWKHGETLVRETYFERYAQELADDIGAVKDNAEWPYTCIDWKQAAKELMYDYTALDFDGVTYYARS